MKRTHLKRKPIHSKRTKNLFDKEFDKMRPMVRKRSQGRCEAPQMAHQHPEMSAALAQYIIDRPCQGRAVHVNHQKYRSRGGTNSLDNLLDVCLGCHGWIHHNELFSNALCLSLRSHQSESER